VCVSGLAVTSRRRLTFIPLMEGDVPMTTANDSVRIVPLTVGTAEVRLGTERAPERIGKVGSCSGRWFWQHRDGEQSSPVATNRSDAAHALAEYHRAFKRRSTPAAPVRRLLFS